MPVNDQHVAKQPKVHRVPPRTPIAAQPSSEEEATVATAVPLDQIEEDGGDNNQVVEGADEGSETIEAKGPPATIEDDSDDEDLSLLEDAEDGPIKSVAVASDEPEEGFLEIFSENCLQCSSLVPFAKKKFKACHYSAGNKNCPASNSTIVIRVPLEEIVPRFMSAERARDFHRLSKLSAVLASKPDWYQQRVASALEEARAKV